MCECTCACALFVGRAREYRSLVRSDGGTGYLVWRGKLRCISLHSMAWRRGGERRGEERSTVLRRWQDPLDAVKARVKESGGEGGGGGGVFSLSVDFPRPPSPLRPSSSRAASLEREASEPKREAVRLFRAPHVLCGFGEQCFVGTVSTCRFGSILLLALPTDTPYHSPMSRLAHHRSTWTRLDPACCVWVLIPPFVLGRPNKTLHSVGDKDMRWRVGRYRPVQVAPLPPLRAQPRSVAVLTATCFWNRLSLKLRAAEVLASCDTLGYGCEVDTQAIGLSHVVRNACTGILRQGVPGSNEALLDDP
ncbi:hypothetical protein LY76DRAFT_223801 [Colletotrichum caudatum]|nr:hypothetical protein LY76DRAFT_223801 [Colletotrichum caudatum]